MSQPSCLIASRSGLMIDGSSIKSLMKRKKFMQISSTPESLRVSESSNAFACFRTIERKEVINLNDAEAIYLRGKIEIPKRADEKFSMPLTHA